MSKKSRERREAARLARGDGGHISDAVSGSMLLESNSELMRERGVPLGEQDNSDEHRRTRKIYLTAVIILSVVLAVVVCLRMYSTVNEQLVLQLRVNEVDVTSVEDGVYTSSYSSSHMSATVEVSISSGRMVDISLTGFTGIDNARAREVFDRVLYYQMLNVPEDEIGTKPTDKIVLKAIENTLVAANEYREE